MRSKAKIFCSNVSGVAAIEFALLAPIFCYIIFLIFQIGLYLYFLASLDNAVSIASRQVLTGRFANSGLSPNDFRTNVLCPLLPSVMSCNSIILNSVVIGPGNSGAGWSVAFNPTWTALNMPSMDNSKTTVCLGNTSSIVAMQVYYAMPVLGIPTGLGIVSPFNGSTVIFLRSTATWMNEPFSSSYTGC